MRQSASCPGILKRPSAPALDFHRTYRTCAIQLCHMCHLAWAKDNSDECGVENSLSGIIGILCYEPSWECIQGAGWWRLEKLSAVVWNRNATIQAVVPRHRCGHSFHFAYHGVLNVMSGMRLHPLMQESRTKVRGHQFAREFC